MFTDQNDKKKKRMKFSKILLAITVCWFSVVLQACEGTYRIQTKNLIKYLNDELIKQGFCDSSSDCNKYLPGTIAYGDKVRIAFYSINEKNISGLAYIIRLVVLHGMEKTSGVPISITAYKISHEDRKSWFLPRDKPFLVLEINK